MKVPRGRTMKLVKTSNEKTVLSKNVIKFYEGFFRRQGKGNALPKLIFILIHYFMISLNIWPSLACSVQSTAC